MWYNHIEILSHNLFLTRTPLYKKCWLLHRLALFCFERIKIMTALEKDLYQLRRIEEHREKASEKEIRKLYKNLLKELQSYLADIYISSSLYDM